MFDPAAPYRLAVEDWKPAGDSKFPSDRFGHSCVVIGEKMYIFGGEGSNGARLDDLHCFDTGNYSSSSCVSRVENELFSLDPWKWVAVDPRTRLRYIKDRFTPSFI
jgi:hypothetical protein